MRRVGPAAFGVLLVATVGAFFLTQHLKVQNPLINGSPRIDPPAINPVSGRVCVDLAHKRVSFRRTRVGFYLQSRADTVEVYVKNDDGAIVATAGGSGRHVRPGHYVYFTWDGRTSSGAVAPDGTYHFEVVLEQEDRNFVLPDPVRVITVPPRPVVQRVYTTGSPHAPGPALIAPGHQTATIRFTRGDYRSTRVEILRTGGRGRAPVVFSFGTHGRSGQATWNGRIHGQPAPAGTYLVGLQVVDQACNTGTFPIVDPPPPGSTPHAGVTVRYLAAEPPLIPTAAGAVATVLVDSRRQPYSWTLRAPASTRTLEHGQVVARAAASGDGVALHVRMPPAGANVYELSLRSGPYTTTVPVLAAATGRRAAARVLLIVPALTWQGVDPVDDTGDGLPTTLSAGEEIDLERPLAAGLPPLLPDEAALLSWLLRRGDSVQLTSDVALAEGAGPGLVGRSGVILDGPFTWLPSGLGARLGAFVQAGGRVLSVGVDSLQSAAPLRGRGARLTAGPPNRIGPPDPFGARHQAVGSAGHELLTEIDDRLGLLGGTGGALSGFDTVQTILPPAGSASSEAGVAVGSPSVTAFRLDRGEVIEVGLGGFGSALAHNVGAQELLSRAFQLLQR